MPINPITDPVAVQQQPTVDQSDLNAPDPETRQQELSPEVSAETVEAAVDANPNIVFGNRSAEFSFNKDANRVVIKVLEGQGQSQNQEPEVVRQVPPEDFVRFLTQFRELFGVTLDEEA